jgi:hypothetical protein
LFSATFFLGDKYTYWHFEKLGLDELIGAKIIYETKLYDPSKDPQGIRDDYIAAKQTVEVLKSMIANKQGMDQGVQKWAEIMIKIHQAYIHQLEKEAVKQHIKLDKTAAGNKAGGGGSSSPTTNGNKYPDEVQ